MLSFNPLNSAVREVFPDSPDVFVFCSNFFGSLRLFYVHLSTFFPIDGEGEGDGATGKKKKKKKKKKGRGYQAQKYRL